MDNVTVLYFMTTGWHCPACHGTLPHVKSVCSDMSVSLEIVDVSDTINSGEAIAGRYGICGLPTVVVLRNEREVGRVETGVTKQAVIDLVKSAKGD